MNPNGYFSSTNVPRDGASDSSYYGKISTEQIDKKKKIVSDLMALRRMKYQQQGRQGSPFNLNISPLPDIPPDHIESEDLEPLLQDTILKEELGRLHGKKALHKAAEHFTTLSNFSEDLDKKDEAETKRVKFVSNITQRRKLKMEKDRERRMHKQQALMNRQIDLTQKELIFLSKNAGYVASLEEFEVEDLPKLVENTEKNLKSMERNLRILKIKHANDLLLQFKERVWKAEIESLKANHEEGYNIAVWIINEILQNVEKQGRINDGYSYDSEVLEQLLIADKAQYDRLQFQITLGNANLEVTDAIIDEVCDALLPEIADECCTLALITAVYSDDVVVQSTTLAVPAPSKTKLKSKQSNIQLVDDSYANIKQNREIFRKGTWYHTSAIQKRDMPTIVPSQTKAAEPQIVAPTVDIGDGAEISSENAKPKLDTKFGNSTVMKQHTTNESALWRSYSIAVPESTMPPRRTVAINVASLSTDHKLLALGSYKGDVLVYDVLSDFTLIRAVIFHGKVSDSILLLHWSLDNSRLLSMSSLGCIVVWSVSFTPYVSKSDISALNITPPTYSCQQLTALCVLESAKGDLVLKDSSFSEGASKEIKPAMVQFHPTLSSAAAQDSIVVAMQDGALIKCNLSSNLCFRFGSSLASGLEKNTGPATVVFGQPPISTQKVLKIGQDIEVELFKFHRKNIIQLCFAKNCEDMISIDAELNVAQWRHKAEHLTSFGWFVPYKKFKLKFVEEILLPIGDDEVVFEDAVALKKKTKKSKSKKVVEQERKRALRELDDLDIRNQKPWYTDEFGDKLEKSKSKKPPKQITRIFAPPEEMMADTNVDGAKFAVLTLKKESELLLKLAYRYYETSIYKAVNLLHSAVSPSGDRIHFVLLYDEHLPRTRKHVSFIDFDLTTMQLGKIGPIQVDISSKRFDDCIGSGVAFFALSRVDRCAGTEYVVSNIDGDVYVHSLLSGRVVIHKPFDKDPKKASTDFQFPTTVKPINPQTRLLYVKPEGEVSYIVAMPLLDEQSYVPIRTIKITDTSIERERKMLQASYKALKVTKRRGGADDAGEIAWFDPEQAAEREPLGHRHMPLPLYMELILNTIVDIVLARATKVRMPLETRKKAWKQDWTRMEAYFSSAEKL